MAIKVSDFYVNSNPPSTDYPNGSVKDDGVPGDNTGTLVDSHLQNDMLGFSDALLAEVGVTPSGVADTAQSSDRLDAIKKLTFGLTNFNTVADLASLSPNDAKRVHELGVTVKTRYHNLTSKRGGNGYIIKTLSEANTDGDVLSSGAPHYYGANHLLSDGQHVAVYAGDEYSLVKLGWIPATYSNGGTLLTEHDNSDAVDPTLDFIASKGGVRLKVNDGHFRVEKSIDLTRSRNPDVYARIVFEGVCRIRSKIYTTSDIALFIIDNRMDFKDFTIEQSGTAGTGFGMRTRFDNQILYCTFSQMQINNFKFGLWARYSVWCSWRDMSFNNNLCGMRMARNELPDDVSNPEATIGWNKSGGWFHNQCVLSNVFFIGGEVGFYGCPMGYHFDTVTSQDQRDNITGSIIPLTEEATGFLIEAGTDVGFDGYGNTFTQCYTEFTRRPFAFYGQRYVNIEGGFVQGGSTTDRYVTNIHAVRSNVYMSGQTGSDWFENVAILEERSTLYGQPAGAKSGTGVLISDDSKWIQYREYGEYVEQYHFSHTTGSPGTITVPTVLSDRSTYKVSFLSLRNGSNLRAASYTVSRWNSDATTAIDISDGLANGFAVSLVSSKITFTTLDDFNWSGAVIVEKVSDFTLSNSKELITT